MEAPGRPSTEPGRWGRKQRGHLRTLLALDTWKSSFQPASYKTQIVALNRESNLIRDLLVITELILLLGHEKLHHVKMTTSSPSHSAGEGPS